MNWFYVSRGVIRICLGWSLFWGFLDKLFGFGFATEPGSSWIDGVSPTYGFLKFATKGPFADFYQSLAGSAIVDWLFMLGLFCIGLVLILGIMVRLAGAFGVVLYALMYTAGFIPPDHNPIVDEHVINMFIMVTFVAGPNNHWFSLSRWWNRLPAVRRNAWLQ